MIKRTFFTITVSLVINSHAYDICDLEDLVPAVHKSVKGIKKAFSMASWFGMESVKITAIGMGYNKAEVEMTPVFECLKTADETTIKVWLEQKTADDAKVILSAVDPHKKIEDLITSQNKEWQKKNPGKEIFKISLPPDEAIERLFQTEHLKAKKLKI